MHTFYPADSRSLPRSLRGIPPSEPMLIRHQAGLAVTLSHAGQQRLRRPPSNPARAIDPRLAALLDAAD